MTWDTVKAAGDRTLSADWNSMVESIKRRMGVAYIVYTSGGSYYAKGNYGLTDYSGAVASTVIQAARDAIADTGKTILVLDGNFPLSATITRGIENIRGMGKGTIFSVSTGIAAFTVKKGGASMADFRIQTNHASAIGIDYYAELDSIIEEDLSNVFIERSGATSGSKGIYMRRAAAYEFTTINHRNVYINGFTDGIYADAPLKLTTTNCVYEVCTDGIEAHSGVITMIAPWFELDTVGLNLYGACYVELKTPKFNTVTTRYSLTPELGSTPKLWVESLEFGYDRLQITEHHTSDDTLLKEESNTIHTTLGQGAGALILTLPQDAPAGTCFEFIVLTNNPGVSALRLEPGAAGAVYINGAKQTDNKYVWADDLGDSLKLVADGNGDWVATSVQGTWGVEP